MTPQEFRELRKHNFKNIYDIRAGMIVEFRDKELAIVIDTCQGDDDKLGFYELLTGYEASRLEDYQDDLLINKRYREECDIMKVYLDLQDWLKHDVMWERGK